jgi:hypothetical protein
MYVQQVIKDLHNKKVPNHFIKLDISKAFDTVNWSYLLDIMSFLGFGPRWRSWVASLWATSSSAFLLNGEPGPRIRHRRGVRQGDPLSPMIFMLVMESLHMLFHKAQETRILGYLHQNCASFRMSLYADDAAVFINPTAQDLQATRFILQLFADASGLITNLEKIELYPIRCQGLNLQELLETNQSLSQFLCTYLGLPLHYKKLPKTALYPLVQKIGNRLPSWKRNLLTYPDRELLVKTVLSAMPTHFLTLYKLSKWAERDIDRFRRSFL